MSTSKKVTGRPADSFVESHFRKVRKLENSSGKWLVRCNYCKDGEIVHRDGRCVKHIAQKCTRVPDFVRREALQKMSNGKEFANPTDILDVSEPSPTETDALLPNTPLESIAESEIGEEHTAAGDGKVTFYFEKPLNQRVKDDMYAKLLRFVVSANIPFSIVENDYFRVFMKSLRPTYDPPSRFVLSHTVLDNESSRIQIEDEKLLGERTCMTLLCDGWEDAAGRSIYTSVAAEVGKPPILLGLKDMTGQRARTDAIIEVNEKNLSNVGIKPTHFAGLCTDNPTTMLAFRREWEKKYTHTIIYGCRLHQQNILLGKTATFIKGTIKIVTRIVSFFNRSHFWGGKLQQLAKAQGITRGLTMHTETRWYATAMMLKSVREHRHVLRDLCEQEVNTPTRNGLSTIPTDIIRTVTRDLEHWDIIEQYLRICGPLVDAIGNMESRDVTLGDCTLELLRCAHHILKYECRPLEDEAFVAHAQQVLITQFHALNSPLHWLCLFLHPHYRRLALSNVKHSRSFDDLCDTALGIARKWGWDLQTATQLIENLRQYAAFAKPFDSGSVNARAWWLVLLVRAKDCPLKSMAAILLGLSPHAADVERLFSNLGSIHGKRQSRLQVETIERLGRMRSHYLNIAREKKHPHGNMSRRTTARMASQSTDAVNLKPEDASDCEDRISIPTVLTSDGHELLVEDDTPSYDIEYALTELEGETVAATAATTATTDGTQHYPSLVTVTSPILPDEVYDFDELERVLKGGGTEFRKENLQVHHNEVGNQQDWDIQTIKARAGIHLP